MVLNPGKLNVFFVLQTLSASQDDAGGTDTPVWTTVAEFWGSMKKNSNSRNMRYTEMVTGEEFTIETYYMRELEELDKLDERARVMTDSGKYLYINHVENVDEMNQVHVISAAREK